MHIQNALERRAHPTGRKPREPSVSRRPILFQGTNDAKRESRKRPTHQGWGRRAPPVLTDPVGRGAVDLALFYDAKVDVSKVPEA
jgi:hypothetical protein